MCIHVLIICAAVFHHSASGSVLVSTALSRAANIDIYIADSTSSASNAYNGCGKRPPRPSRPQSISPIDHHCHLQSSSVGRSTVWPVSGQHRASGYGPSWSPSVLPPPPPPGSPRRRAGGRIGREGLCALRAQNENSGPSLNHYNTVSLVQVRGPFTSE